ncbi:hypothetical protein PENSOL_c002G09571 [Penicillium solitum]|uniref:Uncharacterized protein n=1 Tax=Penicillium solitum TaxID=60172 RepID=A0A1V6RLQ2_9EURO|nr:uncharacterized protein PENSOL_c002G09571 [Penicillium solitum]OQE02283.1 hypothetical protein PENSOL_c002G09571 [Penicillium solitum]
MTWELERYPTSPQRNVLEPTTWISFSIHIVLSPKSHLCPLPFNITTELLEVLVQRSVVNEILALTNTIAED